MKNTKKNPALSWVEENMPIDGREHEGKRAWLQSADDFMDTLRLVELEDGQISNIKESSGIKMLPPGSTLNKRVLNYLTAWRNVVQYILDHKHDFFAILPADFIPKDHPLMLKQAQSVEDFEQALMAKHRLGWMVR